MFRGFSGSDEAHFPKLWGANYRWQTERLLESETFGKLSYSRGISDVPVLKVFLPSGLPLQLTLSAIV